MQGRTSLESSAGRLHDTFVVSFQVTNVTVGTEATLHAHLHARLVQASVDLTSGVLDGTVLGTGGTAFLEGLVRSTRFGYGNG